ncbi:MAG: hypothetical protein OXP12_05090 [Thaumarchaeota archaeon]|nr:hypothetical protein [Nitrososphaerota archaeon]MDE0266344.1 hypothetical protein [Nitrososphaerota archaeon]MDE0526925.1 hypothetical protein [Nitrososphaerota archaeon]
MAPTDLLDEVYSSKPRELVEFLRGEVRKNKDMNARFQAMFAERAPQVRRDEIDRLYEQAADRHGWLEEFNNIDFDPVTSVAEIMKRRGDYAGAAGVYRELSDAIADHMDMVDDSDAYYATTLEIMLEDMTNCVKHKTVSQDERKKYIEYLVGRCKKDDPDFFTDYFMESLDSLCTNDEYRRYRDVLLAEAGK